MQKQLEIRRNKDVNQDKHIGVKEFDLLLKNLEFRETLLQFGGALSITDRNLDDKLWLRVRRRHSDPRYWHSDLWRDSPGSLAQDELQHGFNNYEVFIPRDSMALWRNEADADASNVVNFP